MIEYPEFKTTAERLSFMVKNKDRIIAAKKSQIKLADCIDVSPTFINTKTGASKANDNDDDQDDKSSIRVIAVINTTNLMDSHDDVHYPGIWDKSLNENKMIMHLQEHVRSFKTIISDGEDLKAFVRNYTWKELGYDYPGQTQALVFDSLIKRERNEFMHEQYVKGYVKNHSVGMRYIKMLFAVSEKRYANEYEIWEQYYKEIANKEKAEERGYFWLVKEAAILEGSSVPLGSNWATPTISVSQPSKGTAYFQSEPPVGTPKSFDYKALSKFYKL